MAGKGLKARNTKLEGDHFEIITGYDTIAHMGEALKSPISPELKTAIEKLATENGAAPAPLFATAPAIAVPATPAPVPPSPIAVLLSLSMAVLKTVKVSVLASFWEWHDGDTPGQPRYYGHPTSWFSKVEGYEDLRIAWLEGRDAEGNIVMDSHGKPKVNRSCQNMCSKLMEHGFRLEPFDNGAPPPTLAAAPEPEVIPVVQGGGAAVGVPVVLSDTHLLSKSDLSDVNVLLALARAVVSPAAQYFLDSMEGKRGGQLARMKAVRFFNPLHVLACGGEVTEADIDGLKLFRMHTHTKIAPKIKVAAPHAALIVNDVWSAHYISHVRMHCSQEMSTEIPKYNSIIKGLKPYSERLDAHGNDSFTLLNFWRANEGEVPAFAYVLRAVLANAPNSIPPERVFSILNNTFDNDQDRAKADYIELALQLQFNSRSREYYA